MLDGFAAAPADFGSAPFAVLVRRLALHSTLDATARTLLAALPAERRSIAPYGYLVRQGQPTSVCAVLLSGFAFRQKTAANGGRQIVALHVPGDALDLQNLYLGTADHAVQALTAIDVAVIDKRRLQALAQEHPGIGEALTRETLIEAALYREWMLNLGRRDARTRIAHFLSELFVRLSAMGLVHGDGFELPMSQEQLGDLVGLTPIHVNRMLKALDQDGLIVRDRRHIRLPDARALAAEGDFDPAYLHLLAPARAAS